MTANEAFVVHDVQEITVDYAEGYLYGVVQ